MIHILDTDKLVNEIKKVIRGKDSVIRSTLMAILSKGHILLEDVPGVGKTTLALAFSKAMGLKYNRIQFTPDVMPSDITGFTMYNKEKGSFDYVEGAAMCNILLADEINRTSPRTQSALLEVMEEGRVTVDTVTRQVPSPFIVIATQNPFGSSGTQRLPQSQLDRFLIRLSMGYPDRESEINILKGFGMANIDSVEAVMGENDIKKYMEECAETYMSDELLGYIADISSATRRSELFSIGISPRGSIACAAIAKACAYISGRDYTVPEDILDTLYMSCAHRIELSEKAYSLSYNTYKALESVISSIKMPKG